MTHAVAVRVPTSRYTSPDFAERERRLLWPSVWQVACSLDHVRAPGDVFEHRCGDLSVIVVRGDDGELRAFQNACRHRGNSICQGASTGATELRCAYHRWAWDLTGRLREVPSRQWLAGIDTDELPLVPVQVDTWGPLVFVCLDLDAPPLAEWLEDVPADCAWARLEEFACSVRTSTPVPCNWKVVADGFSETYHVQGIHPEMLRTIDDVHTEQRIFGRHGVSQQDYGVPSPRLGGRTTDADVWQGWLVTQGARMGVRSTETPPVPDVPDGSTLRDVIAERIRAHQATLGVDLSGYDTAGLLRLSQYNLFPNCSVLVWGDMVNVLVAMPGPTPDAAVLVTYLLGRRPAGADHARPFDVDVPVDADFGTVINQDVRLLTTMQRGLHQPGVAHITLTTDEVRIRNFHENLSATLGLDE